MEMRLRKVPVYTILAVPMLPVPSLFIKRK